MAVIRPLVIMEQQIFNDSHFGRDPPLEGGVGKTTTNSLLINKT